MKANLSVRKCFFVLAAFAAAVANVVAQNARPTVAPGMNYDQGREFYRAGEFSFDAFGSGSLGKESIDHISGNRLRRDTRLGAGAGVDYFFTRMIGVSGMAYSEDTRGSFIDSASADLILRFPIGLVAPYVLGDGGYQFERIKSWFGEFGGGVEVRFTPHVGIFADARAVVPEHNT